jgi:hypothetical protein
VAGMLQCTANVSYGCPYLRFLAPGGLRRRTATCSLDEQLWRDVELADTVAGMQYELLNSSLEVCASHSSIQKLIYPSAFIPSLSIVLFKF